MLNPEGWVTRAIGAICREAHWTTYYKLIERAQVPIADLSIRLLQLVQWVFPAEGVNLIIDDTLVPRCAKTGPGIGIKHDHSHKAGGFRPQHRSGDAALHHCGLLRRQNRRLLGVSVAR
jgi:hypothetical protein